MGLIKPLMLRFKIIVCCIIPEIRGRNKHVVLKCTAPSKSFDEILMMRAALVHKNAVAVSGGWGMVVATPET